MADIAPGNMSPEEYAQQQALSRQQQMATLLMQQGQQQPQGQMVSGRYVPTSFFQNLLPIANIAASQYVGNKADTEQAKLAAAIRQNKSLAEQKIADLAFGKPAVPGVEGTASVDAIKPDMIAALREINNNYYGAGADIKPLLYKQMMPEDTPEQKRFKAAVADGSWNVQKQGGLNAFLNQMSEKDKADLRIKNAQLSLQQREQAFNLGLPMGNVGGGVVAPQGQAPLRTINPGSPILAPNQGQASVAPMNVMPQANMQGQMPRFNSKPEQDLWLANQKEKGKLQIEAQNALPAALQTTEMGLTTINKLIGDTKLDEKGNVVYGKQAPHPGFSGAVGISGPMTGFGAAGFIPGTDVTDFQKAFKKVEGAAFLQAINALRGTGAISETEGAKATAAITDMSLSQSEKSFIESANDLRNILQKGYQNAQQRAGTAPANLNAKPNAGIVEPKFKYNLQTGQWE